MSNKSFEWFKNLSSSNDGYLYFEEANPGLLRIVGSQKEILDVGCGYGCLGEYLTKKNNTVYGLDISEKAIQKAKTRIHFAAVADVSKPDTVPTEIKEKKFDGVILADILEHLYDPYQLIMAVKPYLKEDGELYVSIPNVANWATRLSILFGRWSYTVSGTLDRTHVRFFNIKTSRQMVEAAGFKIIRTDVTPHLSRAFAGLFRSILFPNSAKTPPEDPTALMKAPSYQFYVKYVFPVERFVASLWKNLLAFQFIYVAKKRHPDIDRHPGGGRDPVMSNDS
jgi:2-polyprenyl-3-methyl-5-hydroxy-6-metoxy-1,4-benzoquinol methylase